jgi:hypothetical protein
VEQQSTVLWTLPPYRGNEPHTGAAWKEHADIGGLLSVPRWIQVRITFTGLNRAFGFDSWSGNDGEGVVLDVFSGATLLGSQALTGGDRDFLGYVLTGVDMATSVRFSSDRLIPEMIGERFYIDNLAGTTATVSYSIKDRGGMSLTSSGTSPMLTVGYAVIQPDSGRTTPSGLAIFGFRQNNVLVTEAGVPASPSSHQAGYMRRSMDPSIPVWQSRIPAIKAQ